MKAWIFALSASTVALLCLCAYLVFSGFDSAMTIDHSRQYSRGLEIEIGHLVSILEKTAMGMPEEKFNALAREIEMAAGPLTVSREGNDVIIGTAVFRVENGQVRSVRRLKF